MRIAELTSDQMVERVLAGDVRAAARLMREIEDGRPRGNESLRKLFPHTGKAWVVGITGSPGAGKSSLTDRLIAHYRSEGRTVGVVAVDPTSPFSGGAILGDRIRMQDHASDPGVFIRSLATRGNLGGLSRAAGDVIRVLDAMGKELILVETVGVGQDEVDIARTAHTTVVVLVPGMGDDVQAIKAGILEVADVFAVNKADHDGADRTIKDLRAMLEVRHATLPADGPAPWEPSIIKTVATQEKGVDDLAQAIAAHRAHLESTGGRRDRETARARQDLLGILGDRLISSGLRQLEAAHGPLDAIAQRIAARELDPYILADEVSGRLLPGARVP
jgi:LAO/AO transport system kinase